MEVELLSYTVLAEEVCAIAANGCYADDDHYAVELPDEKINKILDRTIKSGHESVIEHASYTFTIKGISRSCSHQLVRSRIASFSQQSQRYVNMVETSYITPSTMDDTPCVHESFENTNSNEDWYVDTTRLNVFNEIMDCCWQAYNELIKSGVPEEDARYVLPNACTTNITVTMNARELLHFFNLRMCNRAQWEIRELANKMFELVNEKHPKIFKHTGPNCWFDGCKEDKPCGTPPKRQ